MSTLGRAAQVAEDRLDSFSTFNCCWPARKKKAFCPNFQCSVSKKKKKNPFETNKCTCKSANCLISLSSAVCNNQPKTRGRWRGCQIKTGCIMGALAVSSVRYLRRWSDPHLWRWAPRSWRWRRPAGRKWCSGRGPAHRVAPPRGRSPSAACGSGGPRPERPARRRSSAARATEKTTNGERSARGARTPARVRLLWIEALNGLQIERGGRWGGGWGKSFLN